MQFVRTTRLRTCEPEQPLQSLGPAEAIHVAIHIVVIRPNSKDNATHFCVTIHSSSNWICILVDYFHEITRLEP